MAYFPIIFHNFRISVLEKQQLISPLHMALTDITYLCLVNANKILIVVIAVVALVWLMLSVIM